MMRMRSASSLIEVIVALAIVATFITVGSQWMSTQSRYQEAATRRIWAMEALANVMERLSVQEWEKIANEPAGPTVLPAAAQAMLPQARLGVEVVEEPGPPFAKRIRLTLDWQHRSGRRATPVQLSAWAFSRKEPRKKPRKE